jgi:hypothetical protein
MSGVSGFTSDNEEFQAKLEQIRELQKEIVLLRGVDEPE